MTLEIVVLTILLSAAGNMISLAAWFHFDIEGRCQAWRLAHHKRMTERQRRLAREHGNKD
jgi:hypothetical protein